MKLLQRRRMLELKPSIQFVKAAKKANQVLEQIARSITYRDKFIFARLHKVYVRPHLQYYSSAWSPCRVGDKELLENVHRRSVRMIFNISGSYEHKLTILGLISRIIDRGVTLYRCTS